MRCYVMENNCYPFENLPLPYSFDALEPFIDEKTMRLHHDKHLQTYINNLNKLLEENPRLQGLSLENLIKCKLNLPREKEIAVRNNAGGVYNHRFYFDLLKNPSDNEPSGTLLNKVECSFKSFDNFKSEFKKAALSVFGSGYAWLVSDCGKLRIVTTANQNNPLSLGLKPILTIDVWEHAYYLKHYNLRADYIDDWFNVVNWDNVSKNL